MENEAEIIESLKAVGYKGKYIENEILNGAISAGPKCEDFRDLITWLTNEIHVLRKTDENVAKGTDFNEFMLELSGLLKEIGCPYEEFIAGPLTGRFQTRESRVLLLDFLITELMTAKMYLKLKPDENDTYVIPIQESTTAQALESITKELALGKPPENISSKALFQKIAVKLDEVIKKTNPKKLLEALIQTPTPLTNAQWGKLESLQKALDSEYDLRRQMLLTRLDVTVESFKWSEKMKGREEQIMNRYQKKKSELVALDRGGTETDIPALLAARTDLAIIEKTSSANVRKNTGSKIQKYVIGKVPDRGGRAYEHAPPPPEMPSWQQQRSTGGGEGRGRNFGGGGGHRGGGGRQQQQNQQQSYGNYNQQPQRQPYEQRPQYNQGYDQRQQYNVGYDPRQQQFMGSRVQGGYNQGGGFNQRGNDNYSYGDNHGRGKLHYQNQGDFSDQNSYSGGDRGGRGRSSYRRGGGGRR